ncbi:hypothetical protein GLX27_004374 [Malassezia furfur]|uniref:USP8 dimerisation domain-containing protein n=1 Tax=Malassezia furfur TaxID=55194 RepID=A0ABY8EYB0_MALFU|nr:hypothetical protein GLX27_004374 [Malassezia furfur]
MPLAGHAPRNGTQVHKLTVPTNLVPFGGTERTTYAAGAAAPTTSAATGAVAPTPPTPRLPASPDELDAQVATLRDELRFTSAMPIRHWIRTADLLKRQADQHHVDGDLEAQYVCLAKCARILTDLLPNEHTAYARLDDEARDRMRRNGETINHLVALTRDALNDARRTASPPPPALLPSPPPSASRAAPARPSLRTGDSPAKDAPDREGRSPALKRVSFAEGSARTASPSPVRRVLRRAFARGSEPAEGAAAPDEGAAAGERAAPWWAPRARPKPASHAPASHAPLARPSRLSLTSHAPADTPLLQAQPSKAAKRRSWGFADLFPSGAPAKAPAAAAAAPAAAPTSPPAPAARSPPQLAPLQLPTSPLLETAPLSPRGMSPTPTSPRAASASASPRKSSGAAAVPAALQIAPNRLTSPTEKSLRSVQGEGHTRSMVYPYTHGTRSGKSAWPPPSSAPPTDLYEALAQHMSTHQQQQGFVAAADVARAGAGGDAQGGASKAAAATAVTASAAPAAAPAARPAADPAARSAPPGPLRLHLPRALRPSGHLARRSRRRRCPRPRRALRRRRGPVVPRPSRVRRGGVRSSARTPRRCPVRCCPAPRSTTCWTRRRRRPPARRAARAARRCGGCTCPRRSCRRSSRVRRPTPRRTARRAGCCWAARATGRYT